MTDNRDLVRVARAAAVNDLEWHFRGADGAIAKGRLIDMQRATQATRQRYEKIVRDMAGDDGA